MSAVGGVRNVHVQAAKFSGSRFHHLFHKGLVRDITLQKNRFLAESFNFPNDFVGLFHVRSEVQSDISATTSKLNRTGSTNTERCSRNNDVPS
jgi:hypothetical protein